MTAASVYILLAKLPVPGLVKTRLQTEFSADQAAELARSALRDTADVLRARPGRRFLCLESHGRPESLRLDGFETIPQRGGGLDERIANAFDDVYARASAPALLVGMDSPQMAPEDLDVDWLGHEAAFGACLDGGFWAIGFRRPDRAVLLGVPMSTEFTGAVQRRRLVDAGLTVQDLPRLEDVDTPDDARCVAAQAPRSRFARRTKEFSCR